MTFQAITQMIPKIMFRFVTFVFLAGALALPVLVSAATGYSPFCFAQQDYTPVLVQQYASCPIMLGLSIKNVNETDLGIDCNGYIVSLNITDNPSLESISFFDLQRGASIEIVNNPLLKTVSIPMAHVEFSNFFTSDFYSAYVIYHLFESSDHLHLGSSALSTIPNTTLVIKNNHELESIAFNSVNVNYIQVNDNPKLKTLEIPGSIFATFGAEILRNPLLEAISIGCCLNEIGDSAGHLAVGDVVIRDNGSLMNAIVTIGYGDVVIRDNGGLLNATIIISPGPDTYYGIWSERTFSNSYKVIGNFALNTLTIEATGSEYEYLTVYIGPESGVPDGVDVAVVNNPNLTQINLPTMTYYSATASGLIVSGFTGVISFADQDVFF